MTEPQVTVKRPRGRPRKPPPKPEYVKRPERAPYQPYGAARAMWMSGARELVLAGAANTGKSRASLEKLHYCADKYPNARLLMARKTRRSLTQTAIVTYEQKVLPQGWLDNGRGNGGVIHFDVSNQQYEYPNGSIIAVAGMDDIQKVMSSEWDMIYLQEAIDISENEWESLTTRLRNHRMPYQQLLADCNPGPPTHWLKVRADSGKLLMLDSKHEDNPACTPEDLAVLDALTGVRYLRLRKGIWAAAEGLVYEEWEPSRHVLSLDQLVDRGILTPEGHVNRPVVRRVLAGVDFGYTNPGVIAVFCVDGEDRMYLIHEVYQTNRDIDWWLAQAKHLKTLYGIEQFICDPAEPAFIEQFNKQRLYAVKAINDIAPGISSVQARLKNAGDGRPRLFVYQNALRVRDESRVTRYQPYSLLGEILEYVWPKSHDGAPVKEVPVKVNDHSMDVLRYVSMWLSSGGATTSQVLLEELKERVAAHEKARRAQQEMYW